MATTKPRPNNISAHLANGIPIVLDGALATYLETLGADISGSLWSADILLQDPALIKQAHLDYYRAGANVAITASYQASLPGLVKHIGGSEEEAKYLVRRSVELAQDARRSYVAETIAALNEDEKQKIAKKAGSIEEYEQAVVEGLFVAGSVGPYGAFLADGSEYRGDYTVSNDDMKSFHRGRIQSLVEAGVDILAIETIPSKREIEALVELLQTEFPDQEAWFAFTLRDSEHIADGTLLNEVVSLFDDVQQVVALGFNCVPDDIALAALKIMAPLTKRGTLIVYPNSGEQWNAKAREWEGHRTEGSTLANKTVEWWHAGAGLIGGCCRTTPVDIGIMKKALSPFR